jgi:hypothetical protein
VPEIWAEIWTRPGDATFGRVIDEAPTPSMTWHDGVNLVGDGSMAIAESFDRFDEILKVDQATPANSVKSVVRLFSEGSTTPFFEWLPKSILPTTDKADLNVDVAGKGIKSILSDARIEAFDWDGSVNFVPQFPDWIYGGRNILQNGDIENNGERPTVFELWNDGAGGDTFTLDDGVDFTAAIAWDAAPGTVETRLEDDITSYDDVLVTGAGTEDDPWVIEFVTPHIFSVISLGVVDTGMTSTLTVLVFGATTPTGWTKSQTISRGVPQIFGEYDSFVISTAQAHSGTQSLFIDPAAIGRRYAGTQQVVAVKEGGTYQASIWVYPTAAATEFRFIIRGIDEDFIASDTGGLGGTSYPANQWSEVTIPDLLIPEGKDQVIFRFANVDATGNPAGFYVDDGALKEGQAVATIGKILGDIYDDATADHSPARLVWEDEANPGTPYLTIDFSDALDSNGEPWFHNDIEIKLWMRQTYLHVMGRVVNTWGYEWRIVPNDTEAGTWLWQVYNPGTMKTDYTAAQSPAIQGGAEDIRRSIARVLPPATDHLVEGTDRITARYRDSDLTSALGLSEGSRLDRDLPGKVAIFDAAFEDSLASLTGGVVYIYDLTDPSEMPLVAYLVGDLLTIHDPPEVEDEARLTDVVGTATAHEVIIGVQFTPATEAGS